MRCIKGIMVTYLLHGRSVVNIRKPQVLFYHAGGDAGDPEEEPATGKKSVM